MTQPADGAADVALAIAAATPAALRAAGALFPGVELLALSRGGLRPLEPFRGPLFARLATLPAGARVGLVVPVAWYGPGAPPVSGEAPAEALVLPVSDHVNLELRGPLTGPWPAGVPRSFPPLAGVYQPAGVRARGGPRVYSSGVVVAGVADAGRLTPFESSVVRARRIVAVADSLVPPVIVAAYYGLLVAACGVPLADEHDEE